jgi:hypothetical protein
VQVDVQVKCAAGTLNQRDDAGSGTAAGGEPGPVGRIGLDGSDDDREAVHESIGPPGEQQAHRPGKLNTNTQQEYV